jgi:gamma-glutamyl phosphate reductase
MATNTKSYSNLMDGTWKTSIVTPLEDRNPDDHNEIIGLFPMATLDDTKSAIQFGLSAGVVTKNLKEAFAFANQVDAGVIKINEPTTGLALNAPFGGFKGSSANTFKEQGQAAVDFYTRTKTVYANHG